MSFSMEVDEAALRRNFSKWQKKFGDSAAQAVSRLSVGVARETAILVEPKGKSKKKVVNGIVAGARSNIVAIPARDFNKLSAKRRPGFKFGHRWVTLDADQLLRGESEIQRFIEANRDGRGRVRKLSPERKAVAKKGDFNKVLVKRKRLAGIAKGSVLGAGMRAARFQRGGRRLSIGKNFMAWAQKHAGFGTAKRRRRAFGPEIRLISEARHTRNNDIVSQQDVKEASRRAWRKTLAWYRHAMRELDK